jgi:hypothetical protein
MVRGANHAEVIQEFPMIPLRDTIPSRTIPVVNYAVIIICSVAFLAQLAGGPESVLAEQLGFVPARLANPDREIVIETVRRMETPRGPIAVPVQHRLAPAAVPVLWTMVTCMFLHGGWMHFLGNMWFLWIFGDNVEDRLGHFGFALLYLGTGLIAGIAHAVSDFSSPIPTIGASGAIAGVMGAYALLYPHAHVMALIPIVTIMQVVVVPAPVFLGLWFVMQLFQAGVGALGGVSQGVAWWAHVGGFVGGAVVVLLFLRLGISRPAVEERIYEDRMTMGRRYRLFG